MGRGARFGIVILSGVLAYAPSLANPLPFDDEYVVVDNPLLETSDGLVHLLTRPGLTGGPVLAAHYRPLPMASLVRDRLLTALAQGLSESDWAVIARISRSEAGIRD